MPRSPLACTVRGCAGALERQGSAWRCARGHAYDVSRAGYVNLLQPQDRKSTEPGDSRAAVDARAALLAQGVGRTTIEAVVAAAASHLPADATSVAVELGSGSGEALGALASARPLQGIGIDLSSAAAAHAARRYPDLTWVVANADRRLPVLDGSADLVLSIHARRNPAECRRILRNAGSLLVAVPAADDLVELRLAVQGERVERDRTEALVAEHEAWFTVAERTTVRSRMEVSRDTLLALLRGTYRGERASSSVRVQALDRLTVTLASDVVRFVPRG